MMQVSSKRIEGYILCWLFLLAGLYVSSLYSYLLFHTLAEVFSIVVAAGIFMVAWNSRRIAKNNYLLFLGIAYLFVSCLDFYHTLTYSGMNIFHGYGTNLPTQLWISARYVESISLLIAPLFVKRRLSIPILFATYLLITGLFLWMFFSRSFFPVCYIEGIGLTPFKIVSEYIISLILAGAMAVLYRQHKQFDYQVLILLMLSIILTIASELAFTLYTDVYGDTNLIGHLLKILSFYLIYRAIIVTGLISPYSLLFRNLKQREEELEASLKEKEILLREVHHRVKNNLQVITSFLRLQAARLKNETATRPLEESENRIRSMAIIHEMLYKTGRFPQIDFKAYIQGLINSIYCSLGITTQRIALKLDIQNVKLGIDAAITCGLILNELVSNALYYAFNETECGEIGIAVEHCNGDSIQLRVHDNGVGLPPAIDLYRGDSLGLGLVKILVEDQLCGKLEIYRSNGTEFRIIFPG